MLTAEVESRSAGTFQLSDPMPVRVLPTVPTVMQPPLANQFFYAAMKNTDGDQWKPRRFDSHWQKYANGMKVQIRCSDADGQHWTLSNEDDPQRHAPQMGPPPWQRLWTHRREAATEIWALLAPGHKTRKRLTIALAIVAALLLNIFLAWHWQWLHCVMSMPYFPV